MQTFIGWHLLLVGTSFKGVAVLIFYIMSERERPPRRARAQPPPQTEEQKELDDQLYARMFGNNLDEE